MRFVVEDDFFHKFGVQFLLFNDLKFWSAGRSCCMWAEAVESISNRKQVDVNLEWDYGKLSSYCHNESWSVDSQPQFRELLRCLFL